MRTAMLTTWVVRAVWATLPFTAGPALAAALDPARAPLRTTASVGLWALWALVLLGALVPRPVTLTLIRLMAPATLAAAIVAAATGRPSTPATTAALAAAAVVAVVALAPSLGSAFVNGAAYGDERRHLLRAPGPLLLGPIPLAWAVSVAGGVSGPLLLADRQWVAGAAVAAVGLPAAAVSARALHVLARRWLVFVPAGVVLHDQLSLTDPFLFRRATILSLAPAPADTDALDLTQRSPGLALELRLDAEVELPVTAGRDRRGRPTTAAALLFSPTRPGLALAEARRRRIP